MAEIYQTNLDGRVIELSNWGHAGIEDPGKAMLGRMLDGEELDLYKELKSNKHSDSSIWLELHPAWPRGNGREILRPLQRPADAAKDNATYLPTSAVTPSVVMPTESSEKAAADLESDQGKSRFAIRQLTTVMLMRIIEARCQTNLESLSKMLRHDLEVMAESLLGRDYILIDLNDF